MEELQNLFKSLKDRQDYEIELYNNYKQCSVLNMPNVGTKVYYPIKDLETFKWGYVIEIDNKNILANINGVGMFKDKIKNFWTKND